MTPTVAATLTANRTDQAALRAPRDTERDRQIIALRLSSPKRSATDQADAGHLPLFVAANEPGLL